MAEPTQPGELSDSALERALGRLRRTLPLDSDEIDSIRKILKHLNEADLLTLHEVIDQWTYDKRRTAEEARTMSVRNGRLPWVAFVFTAASTVGGAIAGWWFQRPGGH